MQQALKVCALLGGGANLLVEPVDEDELVVACGIVGKLVGHGSLLWSIGSMPAILAHCGSSEGAAAWVWPQAAAPDSLVPVSYSPGFAGGSPPAPGPPSPAGLAGDSLPSPGMPGASPMPPPLLTVNSMASPVLALSSA